MTIKQFIEKAIEGGWRTGDNASILLYALEKNLKEMSPDFISGVVLDPLAWQAVGKIEGWGIKMIKVGNKELEAKCGRKGYLHSWQSYMHDMIDALAEGKSIEDYISTL